MNYFLYQYKISLALFLFATIYLIIQIVKPACFYKKDGTLCEFGIGYKSKTIFPVWLMSIILGVLCYLFILYLAYYN